MQSKQLKVMPFFPSVIDMLIISGLILFLLWPIIFGVFSPYDNFNKLCPETHIDRTIGDFKEWLQKEYGSVPDNVNLYPELCKKYEQMYKEQRIERRRLEALEILKGH